jgi:ribosomal protein S18 acetylase RimI-like enzyme
MAELRIRPVDPDSPDDADRIAAVLAASWGEPVIVSRGVAHDASRLPALLAEQGGELVGVLTYEVREGEMEVVSLDVVERHVGVGSRLLAAAVDLARTQGLRRLWLITTNDNLDALRFYQRRGLRIVAVHGGGVDAARQVKPSIPLTGDHGIELHDELELEVRLVEAPD